MKKILTIAFAVTTIYSCANSQPSNTIETEKNAELATNTTPDKAELNGSENSQKDKIKGCPWTAKVVSDILGQTFEEATTEPGILGDACVYKGEFGKVWIDAGVPSSPKPEMMRDMYGAGHPWKSVAGDSDNAVIEVTSSDNQFPSISYIRKGHLVVIRYTGTPTKNAGEQWDNASLESYNKKLLSLPRIP